MTSANQNGKSFFQCFALAPTYALMGLFNPNLGILLNSDYVDQIVANPIIYRLIPSPSRYEIRPRLRSRGTLGRACPRSPCEFSFHFVLCIPRKAEGSCFAVLQRFEIFYLRRTTDLFSTARLVSNDIRFP